MVHHDRVRPKWLPTYASQLNLLERVWDYVNGKPNCYHCWADGPALDSATIRLLSHLQARFHQPDPDGIALVQNFFEAA